MLVTIVIVMILVLVDAVPAEHRIGQDHAGAEGLEAPGETSALAA